MPKDYSPFSPGQPVRHDLFVGRKKEIDVILKNVLISSTGRINVVFLSGERGIGKSSLASFVKYIAEIKHDVLCLHTFLGGIRNLNEMVNSIFEHLLNEIIHKPWYEKIKDFFTDRISEVDLFGTSFKFKAGNDELKHFVNHFGTALKNLQSKIKNDKKGLFIVLDEINGLTKRKDFANWLKSFVDEIATGREPLPLCLLLVGTEERRRELASNHESLARYFDLVEVHAWSNDETEDFYQKAFSKVGVGIEDSALNEMVGFTGGLPVLAHEIGDAVFYADTDYRINDQDASVGIIDAADAVGRKYLELKVFKSIKSPAYRNILRKLAAIPGYHQFKRDSALSLLNEKEKGVLDGFLSRMVELGVLTRQPESKPGIYQFKNLLHHLYYKIESMKTGKLEA